ncbi:hypothetical protein PPSIR1_17645 [Plesiocystis pacifica SIR-1]|uniref:Uncharacterized protein n=1 Tax=Plesiocystis pacifica SIR-1 TaxID=391625 RepID=A6GEB3_9BACT|nr:hypothetical protein [Plesiocystis pacifica]EDM75754.1 hypothetical protein PPSIR1_17645 [Plesiocystis pacifica SIR-1]
MKRLSLSLLACSFTLALACDKAEPAAEKADKATKEEPKADEAKADGDAAKADEAKAAEAEAKHLDVSADKSGALARAAAVLETNDNAHHSDVLADISHHAEKLASDETVCKHIIEVRGSGELDACVKEQEHHVVLLGPEIYAQAVECLMDASTAEQIDLCVAAEKEAELLLHEKPHGDGLDEKTCTELFDQFEKLAIEDAKDDHPEVVKEILEEVRADVVETCMDQGTKAEVECGMKATTLAEVKECAPKMM